MAKNATGKSGGKAKAADKAGRSVVRSSSSEDRGSGRKNGLNAGETFIKLLQSPFVAELVAVAATAALAALAEHGFTTGSDGKRGKRAGRAVKEAGKAAAAAVSRRLGAEIDEIRKTANAKGGAKA